MNSIKILEKLEKIQNSIYEKIEENSFRNYILKKLDILKNSISAGIFNEDDGIKYFQEKIDDIQSEIYENIDNMEFKKYIFHELDTILNIFNKHTR